MRYEPLKINFQNFNAIHHIFIHFLNIIQNKSFIILNILFSPLIITNYHNIFKLKKIIFF